MTRADDRLAELLHSAVPPSQGVAFDDVRRRVRQRRALGWSLAASAATAAAVVAAVLMVAPSGNDRPDRVTTTPSVNLAGAVPWISKPPLPYRAPATTPPSPPAADAGPCTARDVTASLADGNGAGGHSVRYVRFRNTGTAACVLKGYPRVTASEPGHPSVAGTDGSFFPTAGTASMRPGQSTYLGIETDTSCAARPGGGPPGPGYHRLDITLPGGGGTVTVQDPSSGFDVTCGLHLTRFFVQQPEQQPAHDPLSDLTVTLEVPPTVAAGSTLVYVADLTNPTDKAVSLARCPGYVEAAGGPTPLKELYSLNCPPVGEIAAHGTVRFEMRLHVPAQAAGGPLTFHWSLATPFSVTSSATVTVTAPAAPGPGVTVNGELRMTGGPYLASQPGVPGSVRFDAVATGRRYSTTAAADGSFTVTVPPGEYTVTGTSPQFNDGSQLCRADGTVEVTTAGLSGVVVACSRK